MSSFIQQYEAEKKALKAAITKAVDSWFTQACHNAGQSLYLYFKPNSLQVAIAAEAPGAEWRQALPSPIPSGNTKDQTWRLVFEALQNCPVYPVSESKAA